MLKILRDLSTFLQTLCHNGEAAKAVYIQHLGCLYQIDRTEIVKNCFGENICLIKTDNNLFINYIILFLPNIF